MSEMSPELSPFERYLTTQMAEMRAELQAVINDIKPKVAVLQDNMESLTGNGQPGLCKLRGDELTHINSRISAVELTQSKQLAWVVAASTVTGALVTFLCKLGAIYGYLKSIVG
jgi:phage host-nuclease inhibitor protein Gam